MQNKFTQEFWNLKYYAILIVLLIFSSYSIYFFLNDNEIVNLTTEDGLFENITCICFATASLFMFMNGREKSWFYILFGLILFFGAAEEISWGQRYWSFVTPDFFKKNNVQGEFNFHNLKYVNRINLDNSVKTGWRRIFTVSFIYRFSICIYGIIIPLLALQFSYARTFFKKISLPIPPLSIGMFFFITWLAFKFITFIFPDSLKVHNCPEEIFEFLSSTVWVCISIIFLKYKKYYTPGEYLVVNH